MMGVDGVEGGSAGVTEADSTNLPRNGMRFEFMFSLVEFVHNMQFV